MRARASAPGEPRRRRARLEAVRIAVAACALLVVTAVAAPAAPLLTYTDFLTLRFAPNPLSNAPAGDFVLVVAQVSAASTPDPVASLNVQGTQGALTVPFDYFPSSAPTSPDPFYRTLIPYAQAVTNVGWSITATDGTGTSAPAFALPIANPVLLPFATDITVSDDGATPTIGWQLPDLTGFSVDVIRFRVIDADSEDWLLNTIFPLSTPSFTVPSGLLQVGGSYLYNVVLEDDALGSAENESSAYSEVVTVIPEPGALALVLAGLAGLAARRRR